jgi:hypothetical protein
VSKVLVKVFGLNVFPTRVQANKTDIKVSRTQMMQAFLIFLYFFFSGSSIFALVFYFFYFVESAAKSEHISKQSTNTLSA